MYITLQKLILNNKSSNHWWNTSERKIVFKVMSAAVVTNHRGTSNHCGSQS